MTPKLDYIPERSTIADNNVGSTMANTGYGGGRGCGRVNNRDGRRTGGCGRGPPPNVGRGYGGQANPSHDNQ